MRSGHLLPLWGGHRILELTCDGYSFRPDRRCAKAVRLLDATVNREHWDTGRVDTRVYTDLNESVVDLPGCPYKDQPASVFVHSCPFQSKVLVLVIRPRWSETQVPIQQYTSCWAFFDFEDDLNNYLWPSWIMFKLLVQVVFAPICPSGKGLKYYSDIFVWDTVTVELVVRFAMEALRWIVSLVV